jgi:hypothetical protein
MTKVIELECDSWDFKQKNPGVAAILNNQGYYATVRKTSNGAGKATTWEIFETTEITKYMSDRSVEEFVVNLATTTYGLAHAKINTQEWYSGGGHNDSQSLNFSVVVTGWRTLNKEEVKSVGLVLDYMKAKKSKKREIRKLEEKAFELRYGRKMPRDYNY